MDSFEPRVNFPLPQPSEIKEKVLLQVVIPVSVSHLVAYNYDFQKIITAYEVNYLRLNYVSILRAYGTRSDSPNFERALHKLGSKVATLGYLVSGLASIFISAGVLLKAGDWFKSVVKRDGNTRLLENASSKSVTPNILVHKISESLSISVMSIPVVEEFTTKEKIAAYGISTNKSTIVYKGSKLYSQYDRIALLESSVPVFVMTDVEFNREGLDFEKDKVDYVIVDSTNDVVKMKITTEKKVVPVVVKLSDVLSMRKYEELDIATLNSIVQRLKV